MSIGDRGLHEEWTRELEEKQTKFDDLGIQRDELRSEIEDLEYEISQLDVYDDDDIEADDNRQRAADMNATLRDIGGGL